MIKAVIIEDIPDNREALTTLLASECPEVKIIGEADTVDSGYQLIKRKQPALVFMDIQLKDGTGFDILGELFEEDAIDFEVIFCTAHGNFENATKAIQYSALDFITKPIGQDKLVQAVQKANRKLNKKQYTEQIAELLSNLSKPQSTKARRIAIHLIKGVIEFVEVDNIIRMEADGAMTKVYLENGKKLTAVKNLGSYSKLLTSDYNFFPISNSIVVNLDYVKRYKHAELTVTLINGESIFASRRGGQDFKKFLNDNKSRFGDLQSSGITGFFKKLLGG